MILNPSTNKTFIFRTQNVLKDLFHPILILIGYKNQRRRSHKANRTQAWYLILLAYLIRILNPQNPQ